MQNPTLIGEPLEGIPQYLSSPDCGQSSPLTLRLCRCGRSGCPKNQSQPAYLYNERQPRPPRPELLCAYRRGDGRSVGAGYSCEGKHAFLSKVPTFLFDFDFLFDFFYRFNFLLIFFDQLYFLMSLFFVLLDLK